MSIRNQLDALARERILILDGAMGTMIQNYHLGEDDFRGDNLKNHPVNVAGCNDLLCLTKGSVISEIHEAYLEAGADIIETCSFNATAVSLSDFGLSHLAYDMSFAAAALARKAADTFSSPEKPRFVAGSVGPTSKSASMSPDMEDPGKRGILFDALKDAYYDNIRGLMDGGSDMILIETSYDTLNVKAALMAIHELTLAGYPDIPTMISATVSGVSGRLLAGQTLEAFLVSTLHGNPWSLGLNCSFGAKTLKPWLTSMAEKAPCLVSVHPNAGLPNRFGEYDETPESMAEELESFMSEGLANIIGGCCGSTPAHIAAIAERAKRYQPRKFWENQRENRKPGSFTVLAGWETLEISSLEAEIPQKTPDDLIIVGERTNAAGSRQFLNLIKAKKYEEALHIPREMIRQGADIINIGMDDPVLDAKPAMIRFLTLCLSDPEIAQVPFMIDSSQWEVIETALAFLQGKGAINSISLKEGDEEFLRKARIAHLYGAAITVMLFDEQGQAATYARKIEIAERSYRLLTENNVPPGDIIFDPNVLTVATGMPEHDLYALDFIRSCEWIRKNCPGTQISGGLTNLSFSFRGNALIREALHSVFLKHAAPAGLTMAILNPANRIPYEKLDPILRTAAEDLILYQNLGGSKGPADRLLALAEEMAAQTQALAPDKEISGGVPKALAWRSLPPGERISHAVISGDDEHIEGDILEALPQWGKGLAIVEGPLMEGIKEVGNRFEAGKMYLPQVIRSARVMKKAVAALEPYIKQEKSADSWVAETPKILLATVKGDVHDIGKNIVSVVLGCNGYEIIDLGVMVPPERIIETALREKPGMIGLSGLITPSLAEMVKTAQELAKAGIAVPLLIGGATTSLVHTALRIAPEYPGPVAYVPDASRAAETARALLSETERQGFLEKLELRYQDAAARNGAINARRIILSLEEARENRYLKPENSPADWNPWKSSPAASFRKAPPPKVHEPIILNDYPLEKAIPRMDWRSFLRAWDFKDNLDEDDGAEDRAREEEALLADAKETLEEIRKEKSLTLRGIIGFFPALSENEDIILYDPKTNAEVDRFLLLRNQEKKYPGRLNSCLADFVFPKNLAESGRDTDWIGLFALSAGFGLEALEAGFRKRGDDYRALLAASLANGLAEAFSAEIRLRTQREFWGYAPNPPGWGIGPAFGYPASPDHQDKRIVFDLLDVQERCGLELTHTGMIQPGASVCGLYLANPASYYFGTGSIGEDQLKSWAERKGISPAEARNRISQFILP